MLVVAALHLAGPGPPADPLERRQKHTINYPYEKGPLSPRFRGALGVSGKVALVVTPSAGAFFLKSHLTVAEARADPDVFVSSPRASASEGSQTSLALWQSAANAVYSHPFKTIIGCAAAPQTFHA